MGARTATRHPCCADCSDCRRARRSGWCWRWEAMRRAVNCATTDGNSSTRCPPPESSTTTPRSSPPRAPTSPSPSTPTSSRGRAGSAIAAWPTSPRAGRSCTRTPAAATGSRTRPACCCGVPRTIWSTLCSGSAPTGSATRRGRVAPPSTGSKPPLSWPGCSMTGGSADAHGLPYRRRREHDRARRLPGVHPRLQWRDRHRQARVRRDPPGVVQRALGPPRAPLPRGALMSERASVVISNHNYCRFLPEAIASAQRQTYPDVEVLVVDDGSTDGSRDMLAGRTDVEVVLKQNGGQTSAMNIGFAASRGDVVIFLDSDDVLLPTAVEAAIARLRGGAVAKVHWFVADVDAQTRRMGRTRPPGLPRGDLRAQVLERGPESYEAPSTSSNAWARAFLEEVMPLPEVERVAGVGAGHPAAYLTDVAPFFGRLERVDETLTLYRVHGNNDYDRIIPRERLDRDRWFWEDRCRRLEAFLHTRGEQVDRDRWNRHGWVPRVVATAEDV